MTATARGRVSRNACVVGAAETGSCDAGVEACDDGNDNNQDACRTNLRFSRPCGAGLSSLASKPATTATTSTRMVA